MLLRRPECVDNILHGGGNILQVYAITAGEGQNILRRQAWGGGGQKRSISLSALSMEAALVGSEKSITERGWDSMLYRADSLAKRKLPGAGVHVQDLMDVSRSAKASSICVGRGVIERSLAP